MRGDEATEGGEADAGMAASDVVRLQVPAEAGRLRLARLVTAGVTSRLDLGVDEVEALRLAVDEAASVLVAGAPVGAVLTVSWRTGPGGALEVAGRCPRGAEPMAALHPLAQELLAVLVADAELGEDDGERWFRLRRRLADA